MVSSVVRCLENMLMHSLQIKHLLDEIYPVCSNLIFVLCPRLSHSRLIQMLVLSHSYYTNELYSMQFSVVTFIFVCLGCIQWIH